MRVLFLNPQSGIAGDMLVGALLALGVDMPEFWTQLNSLELPADEWDTAVETVMRRGIQASKFNVSFTRHGEESHGRHLSTILKLIDGSNLSTRAKEMASDTFSLLAAAEAAVHGTTPERVHFHEVGAVDAIADICGACIALDLLNVDKVYAAAPALGGGTVSCDHGVMAVPVPAVCRLLEGVPAKLGPIDCELTTPTGAALLRTMADFVVDAPAGTLLATGYGAGTKDFERQANVLQAILLEQEEHTEDETVYVVETNLDDMPGEQVAFLGEQLIADGALDFTIIPCTMKKGRPGMILQVLCKPVDRERIAALMLSESTSFGVRYSAWQRQVLDRRIIQVTTCFGDVSVKIGCLSGTNEIVQLSPEYNDCAVASRKSAVPIRVVYEKALQIAREQVKAES